MYNNTNVGPCPTCGKPLESTDEVDPPYVWDAVCENDHQFYVMKSGGDWEIC